MTIHARRRLFYVLLAAFVISGVTMIVYVNGWRFDLRTFRPMKVGAIFVRSFPAKSQIYLDGKPVKNDSGFFQNGTLIGNLFPKTYDLALTLEGFLPWHENISVQPSLVSENKNAVLIPARAEPVTTSTIVDFHVVDGNVFLEKNSGALTLNDKKIDQGKFAGQTSDLQSILIFDPALKTYWLYNSADGTHLNINSLLKKTGVNTSKKFNVVIDPEDDRRLIIVEPGAILLLDTKQAALTNVYKAGKNTVESVIASKFLFAWMEFNPSANTSTLIVYDKFLKKERSDPRSFPGKNVTFTWVRDNGIGILQDDGELYSYDVKNNTPAKIADDVKSFAFANNGSSVAALEHGALEIFLFNQDKDYYRFNLPDIRSAENVEWYGDISHLFVHYPGEVKFLDLKDGELRNFTTVTKTGLARYDEKNNLLYFLENGGQMEKLEFPK